MNIKEEHNTCKLCLNVRNEFREIDELMKQIFDVLLIKMDLKMNRDHIICQECTEIAKKCLKFKLTCFGTEQLILSFSTRKENAKHIKVIYRDMRDVKTVVDEDLDICRLCLTQLEKNDFVNFGSLMNDTTSDMLPEYMPEIDFNVIENPIICTACRENLEVYFKFVLNCLNIEDMMKAQCREERINNSNNLKTVEKRHLLLKDILKFPDEHPQICVIKDQSNSFKDGQYLHPEAHNALIKPEEKLEIKIEELKLKENTFGNISEVKLHKYAEQFPYKEHDNKTKSGLIALEAKQQHTESKQKGNVNRDVLIENKQGTMLDKDISKIKMYNCSLCSYKTRSKSNVESHMLVHKDPTQLKMYMCSVCSYGSKRKCDLKKHVLRHNDISEIKSHRCSVCGYESKYKNSLMRHMLVHKDVSEIKMYKCSSCAYESKEKSNLTKHLLVHQDVSEIKIYNCPLCTYEAKRKNSLTKHMLVHQDFSKVKVYNCSVCAYKTKFKHNLQKHTILVHKDVSEINMFKCSLCAYEAKHKSYLNKHILVHKNISEIKMNKCSVCAYEVKTKDQLKRHMLVHQDVLKIQMYKCSLCAYESKRKSNLIAHMIVHKKVSELRMYKCSLCAYQAKLKGNLKKHMLRHNVSKNI